MYDYLIVGAGFSGCVLAERIATQLRKKVLIVEKRDHIAGNAYDYFDEHGILIHKYGPHIFHTNSKRVWDYLSRFTKWRRYEHKVLAVVDNIKVPVPFNLNSIHTLFPGKRADEFERLLVMTFGYGKKVPILQMREAAPAELSRLADFIYERIFYGYTTKQWGLRPEQLDASVTSRVPIHISRDDRYFQDIYQGIPQNGYTQMFNRILDSENIDVEVSTSYRDVVDSVKFDRVLYTGPVDEFFNYLHGELPYRSLRFNRQHYEDNFLQEVAQVNYPNGQLYTRITEYKHITGQSCKGTTVSFEYPEAYERDRNEPYYPVPAPGNQEKFGRYQKEVKKIKGAVIFLGRLADYRYYNMDQAVARALNVFDKEICEADG